MKNKIEGKMVKLHLEELHKKKSERFAIFKKNL